ncbi:MAG: extracellular solute-binding protein [Chloroflexi bacterium]|nr:extracellular solute-binding protein [Chloroflexota bacterium]
MMRSSRYYILALVMLLFGMLLLGCEDKDEGDSQEPARDQAAQLTPTLPFPVELTMWHGLSGAALDGLQQAMARFQEDHPDISVVLEYRVPSALRSDFEEAVPAGGGPDVLVAEIGWIADLADAGYLVPLSSDVTQQVDSNALASLYPALWYRDRVWGVPLSGDVLVMYTNQTMLGAPPRTVEELRAVAENQPVVLYPGAEGTLGLYPGTSSSVIDLDGRVIFSQLPLMDYFSTYQLLDVHQGIRFSADAGAFSRGEVALQVGYASWYPQISEALGEDVSVHLLPPIQSVEWRPFMWVTPVVISQNAPDISIQAAELLLSYLLSAQGQRFITEQTGQAPLTVADADSLSPFQLVVWNQFLRARPVSPYPVFAEVLLPTIDDALESASEADVALDDLASTIIETLRAAD